MQNAAANLLQPSKKLHFTEKHFQGFWVQLLTLIRRNEHADSLLDGILRNPMLDVLAAIADNANASHQFALAVQLLQQDGSGPLSHWRLSQKSDI